MSDGEELQLIKFHNCQMFFRNTRINLILVLTIEIAYITLLKHDTLNHLVGQSECDGIKFRSSCPDEVCKKVNHRNFAKFTEKHLCQSLFFNTDAGWGKQLY